LSGTQHNQPGSEVDDFVLENLEATPRIELGMEVLQTSALPLGYVAASTSILPSTLTWSGAVRLWVDLPEQAFRDVMARVPAGVVVVSARIENGYRGMTASSLVSISVDPPMVIVGLEREAATRAAVAQTKAFNVSVLTRSQEFLADRFAGRAPAIDPRWEGVPHRLGANGIPLIEGCAAWLECRLVEIRPAGDHDICVGEVTAATAGSGDPLILWDRSFWTLR
jgi:flavin reductase (DIM6/NTAB) family NADH-FMN oxidoreductase RutF